MRVAIKRQTTPTFVRESFERVQLSNPEYKVTLVDPYVYGYLIKLANES